jgi:hypothetical protein
MRDRVVRQAHRLEKKSGLFGRLNFCRFVLHLFSNMRGFGVKE